MTSLTGHLDFSAAPWRPQGKVAMWALKVFIGLSCTEFCTLKGKPASYRSPHLEKRLILPLPGGKVSGKHPEQHPNIKEIRNKNQRPEKQLRHHRQHQPCNHAGNGQLIGSVAPHHPILQLLHPLIHRKRLLSL